MTQALLLLQHAPANATKSATSCPSFTISSQKGRWQCVMLRQSGHACRPRSGLRPSLELQTGRNTAWQPYQPLQLPLQPLAYNITPRCQTLLADLNLDLTESFVDMTCVLLWAGPAYAGERVCACRHFNTQLDTSQ